MFMIMGLCTMLLPCMAVLYKWKVLPDPYIPFALVILLGGFNEAVSAVLINVLHRTSNAVNNNLYVLAESILIIVYFRRAPCFHRYGRSMGILAMFVFLFWFVENIIQQQITGISPFFRLFYSFITVTLSLYSLNENIIHLSVGKMSCPDLLISLGYIVFFSYKFLVEACWIYGSHCSIGFQLGVYNLMSYIDWFCNILYTIAIIWIPRKNTYSIVS